MSNSKKYVRGGARALTGVAITAAAAVGVLLLGTLDLPTIERAPHAVQVNTTQDGARSIVCSGAFAELGADPSRPDIATPVGEASVLVSGDGELSTLGASDEQGGAASGARVLTGAADQNIAAAQSQNIASPTLRGMTASTCVEPVNEQWLVGGGSTLGLSTTLSLGNASDVPATVQIAVFDENGQIDAVQTSGVIVRPKSQQTVSLNGYAPNRERLAVRVTSTGAPVAASLGIARVDGIVPVGAANVTRQLRADTRLVIPGVANEESHGHDDAPTDAGSVDRFPVLVNAIAPGSEAGKATVIAINEAGARTELGELDLAPRVVGGLSVASWPHDATAVLIESEVPVYAAVEGASNSGENHDFQWFEPAPELPVNAQVAAPVADGGVLVLVNNGSSPAVVNIGGADSQQLTVAPGSAISVAGSGDRTLSSTQPIHAGVRLLSSGAIAGYPIQSPAEHTGELTVYTR